MAGKSDYLEAAVLDHILGGPDFERPETVYVALFCTLPNDAGGGTEVASGVGYARVAVANDDTNFPAATGAGKKNGTAVTYPTATASWGTVVGFGLFDALTGGNLLYWGGLTVSKTVAINDTPSFAANSLVITED
jgi:hypothetical protein